MSTYSPKSTTTILNRILDNPTAENVVAWMWGRLEAHLPGLREMQLYETNDCAVIYRGELHGQDASSRL